VSASSSSAPILAPRWWGPRATAVLVVQPLWFIAIYAAITALTPVALAMDRRLGAFSAAPSVIVVAVVDLLRYGPWQHAAPGWLGMVNLPLPHPGKSRRRRPGPRLRRLGSHDDLTSEASAGRPWGELPQASTLQPALLC